MDYVIVIVHGGTEHYQLPLPRMKETYQIFIDSGADVVVNHHQHCYSGYEIYKGKSIFYGLGNFCFDYNGKGGRIWEEGFILKLSITDKIDFELIPYVQCGEKPKVDFLNNRVEFDNRIFELNHIIGDNKLLESNFLRLIKNNEEGLFLDIESIKNRFIKGLQRRKLFPSFIKGQYKLILLNLKRCESYKDMMDKIL